LSAAVAFEKNIGFLLEVLQRVRSQVPDVFIVIAGEGPARIGLEESVEKMGCMATSSSLAILIVKPKLNNLLSLCGCIWFSSRTETQGLVLPGSHGARPYRWFPQQNGTKDVLKEAKRRLDCQRRGLKSFSPKLVTLLARPGTA